MEATDLYRYSIKEKEGFYTELSKKAALYFKERRISRYADSTMLVKIGLSLFSYLGFYTLILLHAGPPGWQGIWCAGMGVAGSWVFFNVVHDSSHNALFRKKTLNRLFCYSFELIGANSYIWNYLHNGLHHSFTSIENIEILTDVYPIIRVSQNQPYKKIYRYQHGYAIFIYCLFSLFWLLYIDFDLFAKKRLGNVRNIRHPRNAWVSLWVGKLLYVFFTIVVPHQLLHLGWGTVITGFLIMQLTMGLIISVISAINHFPEDAAFAAPDEHGDINVAKKIYELEATTDFSPRSSLASWLFGGFNTHAAHHLFPNVCHIHYRAMTKLIRETAAKYPIRYKERSLPDAVFSHFRYLKKMSVPK